MATPKAAGTKRSTKISCFFVKGVAVDDLERIEFYAQDVKSLRDAGYDVRFATRIRDLRRADVFYVWWWTWAFIPVLFAKICRRPVIVSGVLDINYYAGRPWWHRLLMRLAFAIADRNVFTSRMEFDDLPSRFFVRHPAYAPLTVDTREYRPDGEREPALIGTVAWLQQPNVTRKCVVELIRAAAIVHRTHPEVRFVLAGAHGNFADAARSLVHELDADSYIALPGAITRAEKVRLMQSCTVYLQPTRYEGFGLAILEAMSCGAPVLTSAAGAVPEVVGDAALVVDGTNPEHIATELRRILSDHALRRDLSTRARARVESTFPYERRRRDIGELLQSVSA
jgi:glycosyltransferase involved in cell wall biosynthesis